MLHFKSSENGLPTTTSRLTGLLGVAFKLCQNAEQKPSEMPLRIRGNRAQK